MSLADELLADLEGDDDIDDSAIAVMANKSTVGLKGDTPMETDDQNSLSVYTSVRSLANLIDSEELARVMDEIKSKQIQELNFKKCQIDGPVESHPEYKLIVDANNMAVAIDNDITIIHKFVRDKYAKRFPELESLVPSALEYVMTVRELGNDLNKAKTNDKMQEFLTQATIMVVIVTATTTKGTVLTDEELQYIEEGCDIAIQLNNYKQKIYEFVESRMSFIAPNLSAIAGASIAAKLMGLAGGLTKLSKMPACNVEVLGSQRRSLSGFSSTANMPHTGFVFYTDLVQSAPPDLRRKAARQVANKCTIAARIDSQHTATDGSIGRQYREYIEKHLDKLQEPPPAKAIKPLVAPIDQPQKKRGGKRIRKLKERLVITDLRKQANRMNFGEIEDDAYQNDLGFTTGQMGKSGTGRIRGPTVDEKTKVRISKTLHKNLQKQQTYGGSTTVKRQVSGTASSVAFTPLQGLEIVNPNAAETKVNEANAKYFSNTSGFLSVKPKP